MMPTLYYFLQVIICSAVLYVYYLLALRNKRFHQYNRFYLLMIFLVSWIVPLLRIPVKPMAAGSNISTGTSLKFFEVIADSNTHFEEYVSVSNSSLDSSSLIAYGYSLVSIVLALVFIAGIIWIIRLFRKNTAYKFENAVIIDTTIKGAPFSFFHFIFWNNNIDIHSNVVRKILAHEMVHVKEKHTIDKIITAIILCFGWFNPIFWFAKRELAMVHEFIADKKAVNGDASELASILLTASYPSVNFSLTNTFFHSPIKRRISMMTKFNLTRYPYLRRLLILPLIAVVVMLFAFRKQVADIVGVDPVNKMNIEEKPSANVSPMVVTDLLLKEKTNLAVHDLSRVYNVVIDAGHGGMDKGAVGIDGTTEAAISLQISKIIKELNTNSKINIILTREDDTYIQPKDKAAFAVNNKADLFISIHANAQFESGVSTKNGIEVILPKKDSNVNYKASYILANSIGTYLEKLNPKTTLKTRQTGIWVLQHTNCPSALIECGYITDKKDLDYLKSEGYQKKLAQRVLEAAEHYLHYAEEKK